jgi:hypothetical protein
MKLIFYMILYIWKHGHLKEECVMSHNYVWENIFREFDNVWGLTNYEFGSSWYYFQLKKTNNLVVIELSSYFGLRLSIENVGTKFCIFKMTV